MMEQGLEAFWWSLVTKAIYAVLAYVLVHCMYWASAVIGHKTMSPNLDEANAIVKEAATNIGEDRPAERYQLAAQVLRNHTIRQVVAVSAAVLLAIAN